ncbi:hypothetical protein [Pseudobutyrivibrio sp. ACV-2]|uniref:hypothetical protein n=1 Tax=Pseudobutyrivibrio sp. ACV-2 TaxID=1520801 RepID=UPI000B7DB4EF|nr:hypothetical protein [Pseudobutyrivibrio sp. ACV-2]
MQKITKQKFIYSIFLLGIIFVASLPAFRSGIYEAGHDLQFHLGRIQAIADELSKGQFPVRYESGAWYGHGYVCTTFYGNIFLYIPAILFNIGVKLWRCYNIYLILVNAVTVFVSFYSFKRLFRSGEWGLFATGLYMLAGYRLTNLYVRAAVGEYTAMIFIPLVTYGLYRIYDIDNTEKNRVGTILPLVIGATGMIQSHILTTEIVVVLALIYCLVLWKDTLKHLRELGLALLFIFGINAFFIIPFIDSYTSMDLYINNILTKDSIRSEGLYISQLFGMLTYGGGSSFQWTAADEGHLNIGISVVLCFIVTLIFIIIAIAKKKQALSRNIVVLFICGIIAGWVSTVYFPWDVFAGESVLDKLVSSVQYPWRYLMVMTTCFIISGTYSLKQLISKKVIFVIAGFAALAVVCTGYFDYTLSIYNTTVTNETAVESWADKLYLPVDTDRESLKTSEFVETADGIIIPVLSYKNVYVLDENGTEIDWSAGDNNLIKIPKLEHPENLTIRFREPLLWRISEIITLLTICVCVVSVVKDARFNSN